jgi:hypothetical protein
VKEFKHAVAQNHALPALSIRSADGGYCGIVENEAVI